MSATSLQPVTVVRIPNKDEAGAGESFSLKFIPAKLKKKGKDATDRYGLVPEDAKDMDSKMNVLAWMGLEQQFIAAYAKLRGYAINWTKSATDDKTGEFNEVEFQKYAAEFSARGETIKSLLAEKETLVQQIMELPKSGKSPADIALEIGKIGARLSEIEDTIEFKKRTPSTDEDEEEETANATAQ